VVPLLGRRASPLVPRPRPAGVAPAQARARPGERSTTRAAPPISSTCTRSAGRSSRESRTAATTT
jgi:hypothetical protein